MDAGSLYRDVVENDAILREILRSQPCSAPNALFHRANLMEKAEQFVSAFPGVAATKETEQVLWKPCFYKRIEDFRRRIRKYASQSGTDRSIRDHFFKLSGEFQAFLDEAAAYYERLHGYFASSSSSSSTAAALQHSMFRCLIFLGDIARYRELHSHKAKKHFAVAEGFYHRALAILPDNGNPHNQLAVLATYVEAEAIAVYRYCRSLLLPTPFATAEENLVLLFERNRHRALPPAADGGKTITASSLPKDKSAYLKQFLHRLTRLHGLLVAPPPSPPDQHALDSSIVCDALTSLLAAGVLGDALVLKLFAVNMFCICRSNLQSHAISLTLAMAALVLPFVHDKPLLLGPVSVLCDFFRAHPHYLTVTPLEETTSPLWAWTQALADALNRRQEATPYIKVPDAAAVAAAKPHLKESIEVQFFQPLGVEYAFGRRSPAEVADVDATSIRWANVYWFAHATMVPQHLLTERQGVWTPHNHHVLSTREEHERVLVGASASFLNSHPSHSSSDHPLLDEDHMNHRHAEEGDEEDCGEVIVYNPLVAPPPPPPAPPLPSSSTWWSSEGSNITDSPSFGGADLSAFRHLGSGLRPLEALTWQNQSPTWQQHEDKPVKTSGNHWNDLDAVELEGSRYEHQVSSLSFLFEETTKSTPPPPPGFRHNLVTRNPFVVGQHT